MSRDLVSVIIPTYKRPAKLVNAVNSVLSQDYPYIEIIVVDDNDPEDPSRSATETVMQQFRNRKNVKYIKHPFNMNGSAARNTGFKNANGAYIMFLDDDDEFMPGKVRLQHECLVSRDDSWGVCYTTYLLRNLKGQITIRSSEKREGNLVLEELKRNLYIGAGSNLMLRRSVFEDVGGFDENFKRNQDQEFLTRVLFRYKIAYVPIDGVIINSHPEIEGQVIDFEKITEQYLETFADKIQQLTPAEREEVLTVINLQRIRVMILNKRNVRKGLSIARETGIGFLLLMRYLMYLLKRKITRTNYGFCYKVKTGEGI